MRAIYFLLMCYFPIANSDARAQSTLTGTENRLFKSLTVDQGLSQSTVFAIQQDHSGFIWMGTKDGLNRYDGKSFTVYKPVKGDNNSLFSDYIRSLFTDSRGVLWIGSDKGVSCYDPAKEAFKNYPLPVKPGEWFVSCITASKEGGIWVATNTGHIYRLDGRVDRFVPYGPDTIPFNHVQQLMFIDNDLLLATNSGVWQINLRTRAMRRLHHAIGAHINCLYRNANVLWIGSERQGLFRLDRENDSLVNYRHKPNTANVIIDNNVRSLESDEAGNLWIGTLRGLSVFDTGRQQFSNFDHESTNQYNLSQNSVRCIFRDRQNGMWLGTYYGGINYYHKDDTRFGLLNRHTGAVLLNDQVVNVISEDPQGNVWIGTNDKGINVWNRKTNSITYYLHKESVPNTISGNNIRAIMFDGDLALIGVHNGGLNVLNTKTGQFKKYVNERGNAASLSGDMVYSLLKDKKQRIWVGTRTGLNRFDKDKGTFRRFTRDTTGRELSSMRITFLYEDRQGRIWIGTDDGINIFTPDNGRFTVFAGHKLSDGQVTCIAEDRQGRVWIGTRRGIDVFDEARMEFIHHPGTDDVLNGIIYGMQPDNDRHMWITTGKGLIKIHEASESRPQVFNNQTGLGNVRFDPPAFCKTSDGMLFFGGLNGIIYFDPRTVVARPLDLRIHFTGLDVLNNYVVPNGSYGILEQPLDKTALLRFNPEHKQFTISFSTFNYVSSGSIRYLYRLEGFDQDWQVCENLPKATYTNLEPGKYTFQVQAIGPLGEKSPVRSLQIKILPPWWRTNWFYLLLLLVFSAAAKIAYHIVSERIRARNALKKEQNEREHLQRLNQAKIDFFTNISHEFKTPLTLIVAPLEELLDAQVPEKKMRRNLERMLISAKQLYRLVDELMEFRKTEEGIKKLELTEGDIVDFIRDVYISFEELSRQKNISYHFNAAEDTLQCFFDRDVVEKICNNLLSNAFKYTEPGGAVTLQVTRGQDTLAIVVTDTGTGIAAANQERVFERFFQVNGNDAQPGSGVGLAFAKSLSELHHGAITVESEPGKGATFTATLPLNPEVYRADEFVTEKYADRQACIAGAPGDETTAGLMEGAAPAGLQEQHLLVVDDNPKIVEYISEFFEQQYKVSRAFDGYEAVKIMEQQTIDIVISDVMMPGLDGAQLCKRIKQNIRTCHIPVILLTAKTGNSSQIKGLDAGADDYIAKPFSISVLNARVNNILRTRRRLKEYYSNTAELVPENIALNTLDADFLRDAIRIVEANLADPGFSVDRFSREIGMSRSSLYHKLKAITGESTIDLMKRVKFRKAVELLESKQYSVTDVAYMSGFSSLSYFSTSFKQYYGYLPTAHEPHKDKKKAGNL